MKKKKTYFVYFTLVIFFVTIIYLFVNEKQGRDLVGLFIINKPKLSEFENKLEQLNAMLIKEEEHNEKLKKARYWCVMGKERIINKRQKLGNKIIALNKNSQNYQKKKESYQNELNTISDIPYWKTCETDFQARLDKSSKIIDSIKYDINSIKLDSTFSKP